MPWSTGLPGCLPRVKDKPKPKCQCLPTPLLTVHRASPRRAVSYRKLF
jgi:hypothetical protein